MIIKRSQQSRCFHRNGPQLKHLTDDQLDSLCTVLALELHGELDLYRTHTRD
ncbi:hypothetical protein [Streptomyces sp. NBC_01320]|uniref:hypothetical protein n=1 Tax=Streptomyces sp. NBC_01320 TaxID=2903824 RepID=UPI002E10F157|nr:hypothetical protein OG395_47565 [Streptomyces sp. NBC_01320]